MTTKTAGKPAQGQPGVGPSQQDLQAAYRVHTLAQMLYGQMTAAYPWIGPASPMAGMPTFDPTMSRAAMPWMQPWPGVYGNPVGYTGPTGYPWMGPNCCFGSDFPR